MKKILFLHDTDISLKRGAELTITQLVALGEELGYIVTVEMLNNFEETKKALSDSDLIIYNSSSRCNYELVLIDYILENKIPYIKVEYDYNFCVRRNILCTQNVKISNCCNPDKFHSYQKLFANSLLNVFQSPKHFEAHFDFYGEAVNNYIVLPPTVDVDNIKIVEKKLDNFIPFFGDLNGLKGGYEFVSYAKENAEINFIVYGNNRLNAEIPSNIQFKDYVDNNQVLEILGKSKSVFIKPSWPEPSGRLAAEAFLSECKLITNENVGTWSFDFYPNNKEKALKEIKNAPIKFWNSVANLFENNFQKKPISSLGNVLIYKSYGGLGDIFFTLPSLYKLKNVSDSLTFGTQPRLVSFFSKNLPGIKVVNEEEIKQQENKFDKIIELGNYPAFDTSVNSVKYSTHKKVKQHSIQHYIDAIAKFHPKISNKNEGFPYFKRETNFKNPYFVIHPGAGFLLKIWPTENYAGLIEKLYQLFPNLNCKIILGKNDPNPKSFFKKEYSHIDYITGDLNEIGEAMAGAIFHIGNDAGITHVAGGFNVPTVGIYGPTGPGSWGSFAVFNEIIWGKAGNCNVKCNYDVIMNCSDKVCLTSTTIDKVLASLYALLHKSYEDINKVVFVKNPLLNIEYGKKDCLFKIEDNELLIEYKNPNWRSFIENILNCEEKNNSSEEEIQLINLFIEQKIIFLIPKIFTN